MVSIMHIILSIIAVGIGWKVLNDLIIPTCDRIIPDTTTMARTTFHTVLDDMSARITYAETEEQRPGYLLAQQGAFAYYPIVFIPGFVTSGLEVWGGKTCAKQYFRQRLWTSLTSARSFVLDIDCWNEHMKLNPYTGEDPDVDIRLRASEGFAAADYFIANYWVFGKLVENLADVGYTSSTMTMEPYDWRLPYHMLEIRDGYFTKLQYKIEALKHHTGKKVILTSHSMGALVMHHFFTWVCQKDNGKNNNKYWVDDHIHTYINIAGVHLGVPKAVTALLSGEMKDTVLMGTMGIMAEQFFGRTKRRDLWSSWGSLWSMLPKGSNELWGIGSDMCTTKDRNDINDPFCPKDHDVISPMIFMTDSSQLKSKSYIIDLDDDAYANITNLNITLMNLLKKDQHNVNDIIQFLQTYGSGLGSKSLGSLYSLLSESSYESLSESSSNIKSSSSSSSNKNNKKIYEQSIWHDPTRTPLPYAPSMKIFCLYGTGLPTERGFLYQINWNESIGVDSSSTTGSSSIVDNDSSSSSSSSSNNNKNIHRRISDPPIIMNPFIDKNYNNIQSGIRYSDGDASVPLLSLGYMCVNGWQRSDSGLNPSKIPVYTREYKHSKTFMVNDPTRSGPYSADHVDILGNIKMTEDFIRIVTNYHNKDDNINVYTNHIVSDIERIANDININGGGIFANKKNKKNKKNRFNLPWFKEL